MPQLLDDVAELEPGLDRVIAAAGEELRFEIGVGESQVVESEHPRNRPNEQAERVDIGDQVTAVRVDLDEPRNCALLRCPVRRAADDRRRDSGCGAIARGARPDGQLFDQGAVRDVRSEPAHVPEVVAPTGVH